MKRLFKNSGRENPFFESSSNCTTVLTLIWICYIVFSNFRKKARQVTVVEPIVVYFLFVTTDQVKFRWVPPSLGQSLWEWWGKIIIHCVVFNNTKCLHSAQVPDCCSLHLKGKTDYICVIVNKSNEKTKTSNVLVCLSILPSFSTLSVALSLFIPTEDVNLGSRIYT